MSSHKTVYLFFNWNIICILMIVIVVFFSKERKVGRKRRRKKVAFYSFCMDFCILVMGVSRCSASQGKLMLWSWKERCDRLLNLRFRRSNVASTWLWNSQWQALYYMGFAHSKLRYGWKIPWNLIYQWNLDYSCYLYAAFKAVKILVLKLAMDFCPQVIYNYVRATLSNNL